MKDQHAQHAFVGGNDGVPAACPVLSFDFLIRRWMWLFMGYVCAQLNYINSGQIFRLNVKDVQRRQEPRCACGGSAASRGSSGASSDDKHEAGSLPCPCTRRLLSRCAPNYQSLASQTYRWGTRKKTEVKFPANPCSCDPTFCSSSPQSQIKQPCRQLHHFREIWWFSPFMTWS